MLKKKISIAHAKSKKVLILNLKGGVGKSTFTVNLASKLCAAQQCVELIDSDKQVSSHSWAKEIEEIETQQLNLSFRGYSDIALSVKVSKECQFILIDSPGNFDDAHIKKYLMLADYVVVPIQPSPVDLHASLPFIEKIMVNLSLIKKEVKVGFVINRCVNGNPQVDKVLGLLRHFRQYKTLGLMSDSYQYQEPFLNQTLVDVALDEPLWKSVFAWLELTPINNKITHFPIKLMSPLEMVARPQAEKKISNSKVLVSKKGSCELNKFSLKKQVFKKWI